MKTKVSIAVLVMGFVAHPGVFAQSAGTGNSFSASQCTLLNEYLDQDWEKDKRAARDRIEKLRFARDDSLSLLRKVTAEFKSTGKSQARENALWMLGLSVKTLSQAISDAAKINPQMCGAIEAGDILVNNKLLGKAAVGVAAGVFEAADAVSAWTDVAKPMIDAGRNGRLEPSEYVETMTEASTLLLIGCTNPVAAAAAAGVHLGKNMEEISGAVEDADTTQEIREQSLLSFQRQVINRQNRLNRATKDLETLNAMGGYIGDKCVAPAVEAAAPVNLQKMAELADKANQLDKLELKRVLEGAEKCPDMTCLNAAMKSAGKLQNDFADRSAIIATLERTTARLDASRASQEAADRRTAQVALQKQQEAAQAAAAQASENNVVGNALRDAITSTLTGAFSSWFADRMRPDVQTSPSFTPPTNTNSNASGPKTTNNTSGPNCSFKCEIGTPDHCAKLMWVCSGPNK